MYEEINDEMRNILDILPWHDVLFRSIFPSLSLTTLFRLREVNSQYKQCVDEYFHQCHKINLCRVSVRFTVTAFKILTKYNYQIRTLILRNAKSWLSDDLLIPVLEQNNKLQKIDLTNCITLSNKCIQGLASNCPDLRELLLRDCHSLNLEGLTAIAFNCPKLEKVDLTGCWDVNDDAVITLARLCKRIKNLSLSKIYGLTDVSIQFLAHNSQHLQLLNIQGCWRVSNDAVRLLGEYCKQLKGLQVRECRDVNEISLARLRCKGIKIDVQPPGRYLADLQKINHFQKLNLQV